MTANELFGTLGFVGDIDTNAKGDWIACSRKGVFLSNSADQRLWQQIYAESGHPMIHD